MPWFFQGLFISISFVIWVRHFFALDNGCHGNQGKPIFLITIATVVKDKKNFTQITKLIDMSKPWKIKANGWIFLEKKCCNRSNYAALPGAWALTTKPTWPEKYANRHISLFSWILCRIVQYKWLKKYFLWFMPHFQLFGRGPP